jgi:hypothetical protein
MVNTKTIILNTLDKQIPKTKVSFYSENTSIQYFFCDGLDLLNCGTIFFRSVSPVHYPSFIYSMRSFSKKIYQINLKNKLHYAEYIHV